MPLLEATFGRKFTDLEVAIVALTVAKLTSYCEQKSQIITMDNLLVTIDVALQMAEDIPQAIMIAQGINEVTFALDKDTFTIHRQS